MEIALVLEKPFRMHFSCKDEESTPQAVEENEISQSAVKQTLVNLDKDSRNMKFFEENQCSVCFRSYVEILEEDLHIVVPFCGHPLCCHCADHILQNRKKECPLCRESYTNQLFNRMKFNADLEMITKDQTVFL